MQSTSTVRIWRALTISFVVSQVAGLPSYACKVEAQQIKLPRPGDVIDKAKEEIRKRLEDRQGRGRNGRSEAKQQAGNQRNDFILPILEFAAEASRMIGWTREEVVSRLREPAEVHDIVEDPTTQPPQRTSKKYQYWRYMNRQLRRPNVTLFLILDESKVVASSVNTASTFSFERSVKFMATAGLTDSEKPSWRYQYVPAIRNLTYPSVTDVAAKGFEITKLPGKYSLRFSLDGLPNGGFAYANPYSEREFGKGIIGMPWVPDWTIAFDPAIGKNRVSVKLGQSRMFDPDACEIYEFCFGPPLFGTSVGLPSRGFGDHIIRDAKWQITTEPPVAVEPFVPYP